MPREKNLHSSSASNRNLSRLELHRGSLVHAAALSLQLNPPMVLMRSPHVCPISCRPANTHHTLCSTDVPEHARIHACPRTHTHTKNTSIHIHLLNHIPDSKVRDLIEHVFDLIVHSLNCNNDLRLIKRFFLMNHNLWCQNFIYCVVEKDDNFYYTAQPDLSSPWKNMLSISLFIFL